MSATPKPAAKAVADAACGCPDCARPLTAEGVCWHCCDRRCRVCGRMTGSAFIDICWACWFQEERQLKEVPPAPQGARPAPSLWDGLPEGALNGPP